MHFGRAIAVRSVIASFGIGTTFSVTSLYTRVSAFFILLCLLCVQCATIAIVSGAGN